MYSKITKNCTQLSCHKSVGLQGVCTCVHTCTWTLLTCLRCLAKKANWGHLRYNIYVLEVSGDIIIIIIILLLLLFIWFQWKTIFRLLVLSSEFICYWLVHENVYLALTVVVQIRFNFRLFISMQCCSRSVLCRFWCLKMLKHHSLFCWFWRIFLK